MTSAPPHFWVGNHGTGTVAVYDGTGQATGGLMPIGIPQAGGAGNGGPVTGVVNNLFFSANPSAFQVSSPATTRSGASMFMFCSEDGLVSGWNLNVVLPNHDDTQFQSDALILLDNSKTGAVYKGCALGGTASAPLLFAANFSAATVDVLDGGLHLNPGAYSHAFSNPAIPAGFAPFNVRNINGTLFVTYAKQDSQKHDDVAGTGNGYVAMFDQTGTLIKNLITRGSLDSPWGMAQAPSTFGAFAGAFLVGNFGDGTINAFDPVTGKQLGTLADPKGKSIVIPGIWSLNFGTGANSEDRGTLYFTAGIGDGPNNANNLESHGLLGSIQGPPVFASTQILNGGSFLPGVLAPNTWMTIEGNELSATRSTWDVTGSTLPIQVNDVSVKVNGVKVPVSFASNEQVNFLIPAGTPPGNAQVQVTNNGLTSASVQTIVAALCPAFFTFGVPINGKQYLAATHADGTLIAPKVLFGQATPANPGETIVMYGTGFGAVDAQGRLLVNHTIVIDGLSADTVFAGLVGPGLYQFNVTVPSTVDPGDDAFVIALASDRETQPGIFIPIVGSPSTP